MKGEPKTLTSFAMFYRCPNEQPLCDKRKYVNKTNLVVKRCQCSTMTYIDLLDIRKIYHYSYKKEQTTIPVDPILVH